MIVRFRLINQLRACLLNQNSFTFTNVTDSALYVDVCFCTGACRGYCLLHIQVVSSLSKLCRSQPWKLQAAVFLPFFLFFFFFRGSFPPGTNTSVLAVNVEIPPRLTLLQPAPEPTALRKKSSRINWWTVRIESKLSCAHPVTHFLRSTVAHAAWKTNSWSCSTSFSSLLFTNYSC